MCIFIRGASNSEAHCMFTPGKVIILAVHCDKVFLDFLKSGGWGIEDLQTSWTPGILLFYVVLMKSDGLTFTHRPMITPSCKDLCHPLAGDGLRSLQHMVLIASELSHRSNADMERRDQTLEGLAFPKQQCNIDPKSFSNMANMAFAFTTT